MADFQTSTHRSRWIFTPQELRVRHQATNQRAIKALQQYGATRLEVDEEGSLSYPKPHDEAINNATDRHSLPKPLSTEQEQLMRVFYEQKIQEVCVAFHFPHKIQATAIIYFKRFYLQWSVMEHHPKHVMLTCIYLSCKIEENHVSAEDLGRGIHQDHQMILNNELIVLQSLGFDLIVYSPYRALEGFLDNMEEFCRMNNGQFERLKELRETARLESDKIMLTDAPLLFPPGQMALSALRASNEVHQVLHFGRYLESIFSRQHSDHTIIELHGSLNSIDSLVRDFKVPSAKDMKHIDRKLKNCWEPGSQEDSKKREKRSKHKSKKLVDPTAS